MNKPKFLQRYLYKRRQKKQEKFRRKPQYQINKLQDQIEKQNKILESHSAFVEELIRKETQEINKQRIEEINKTDPFKADKWKVIYKPDGNISTVYFNDQELYGVQRFDVDFDAELEGHTPRFTLEGYGSIEIITESE